MSPGSRTEILQEIRRLGSRRPALVVRAKTTQAFRSCLSQKGYLEVETPYIVPAPAPELHIEPIAVQGGYLHTSPEICMKRLFAAGYERIFQICKCFRSAERGNNHLPEFTMLEWYRAGIDYKGLMADCEELVAQVVLEVTSGYVIRYMGQEIDFGLPWPKLSVHEAFRMYCDRDVMEAVEEGVFEELLVEKVEPHLGRRKPTFLYDYPAPMAAMARRKKENPEVEERFELYVAGLELANGFSELNDSVEQRERLEREMIEREKMGKNTFPMPERFLEAVGYMPNGAGIALGIDRFVMLLTDKQDIKEVVAFSPEEL